MGGLLGYLSLAAHHGVMPVGGGLLDQTATFVEALLLWDTEMASIERREIEKAGSGETKNPRGRLRAVGRDLQNA